MRICAVLPTYRRNIILPITLEYLLNQTERIHKIIVVGSCPEDRESLEGLDPRVYYVSFDNEPLSDKVNFSLKVAREYSPDAVLMTSSNTLYSANYLEKLIPEILRGIKVVGNRFMYNLQVEWRGSPITLCKNDPKATHFPANPGRLVSREVLEKLDWDMFPPDLDRGLNSKGNIRLNQILGSGAVKTYKGDDIYSLEVKGPWPNINKYTEDRDSIKIDPGWVETTFPGMLEKLFINLELLGGEQHERRVRQKELDWVTTQRHWARISGLDRIAESNRHRRKLQTWK